MSRDPVGILLSLAGIFIAGGALLLRKPEELAPPPIPDYPQANMTTLLDLEIISLPVGFSHYGSRNGTKIDTIVLHFTDGKNDDPRLTVETWKTRKASAHYINPRNGRTAAFIPEELAAWQCPGGNQRGIGIENMASLGEVLQGAQEERLVLLCRDIMQRHDIVRISGHRFCASTGLNSTNCPGTIFGAGANAPIGDQIVALQDWVGRWFGPGLAATVYQG